MSAPGGIPHLSKAHKLDATGSQLAALHHTPTAGEAFPGHTCKAEMAYTKWCEARGCTHTHCPEGCEHPQPFVDVANPDRLLCGRCWFMYGHTETEMVPCDKSQDGNC